jgi:AraC-like DNA-binding protein
MEDYQRQFVGNLLGYAVQRDLSSERLCRLSGIDPVILQKPPAASVTTKQVNDLWLNASYLTNDSLFGLHFGESLQLAALGIVGQLIQTSQTVGEALTRAAEFMHLLTDLFVMDISRNNHSFTIQLIPQADQATEFPFMTRHLMDLSLVFVLHEADGLVLEKIKPLMVTLPYSPSDQPEYSRVLRCTAIEQADTYTMTFDDRFWDAPILTANYELQAILLQKATDLSQKFSSSQRLKERIGSYLTANAYLGIPTLDELAANFNTSSRSLQRKLQDEGVTYQQLADSIRKSLATHYLESGKHPIKEISYLLGYNELSAFNRAFKRWTGTTPGSYQRS